MAWIDRKSMMNQWAVTSCITGVIGITLCVVNIEFLFFVHVMGDKGIFALAIFQAIPLILAHISIIAALIARKQLNQTRGMAGRSLITVGLLTAGITFFVSAIGLAMALIFAFHADALLS